MESLSEMKRKHLVSKTLKRDTLFSPSFLIRVKRTVKKGDLYGRVENKNIELVFL